MISLFDADDAFADDSAMEYQRYSTDFKLACLKRYFTPPMKPVGDLAAELGVPFSTLAEWVSKARKAGMLYPSVCQIAFLYGISNVLREMPNKNIRCFLYREIIYRYS